MESIFLAQGRGSVRYERGPHRILPERVIPLTASQAVFYDLTSRTELLHADEVRYV